MAASTPDLALLEQARRARRSCAIRACVYAAVVLFGLYLTVGSIYEAQRQGGMIGIFWGAIIFGGIACGRSIYNYSAIGSKMRELEQAFDEHVATFRVPRHSPAPQKVPEAPALRSADGPRAPAGTAPSARTALPTPDAPASFIHRVVGTGLKDNDGAEISDLAASGWEKMIEVLNARNSTGAGNPAYNREYLSSYLERADQASEERRHECIALTESLSAAIVAMARAYYDTPRDSEGRYTTANYTRQRPNGYAVMCTFNGRDGTEINGFLVRTVEGLGFFDLNDLLTDDLNLGTPILIPWNAVEHVYLAADPSLLLVIDEKSLGNVSLQPMTGAFMTIIDVGGKALKLSFKPEHLFSDPFLGRFSSTLVFFYRIGTEVLV